MLLKSSARKDRLRRGSSCAAAVLMAVVGAALPAFGQAPVVSAITGINASGALTEISPSDRLAIVGQNLTVGGATCSATSQEGLMGECGVTVTAQDLPVVVLFADPTQLFVRFPADLEIGPADLVVTVGSTPAEPLMLNVVAFTPRMNTGPDTDFGSFTTPVGGFVTEAAPALEGDVISTFTSGIANVNSATDSVRMFLSPHSDDAPPVVAQSVPEIEAAVLFAGPAIGFDGTQQVNFVLPCGLVPGVYDLVLQLTPAGGEAVRSPAVLIPVGQAPLMISDVQNAASFVSGTVSPGAILTIYGKGFQTTNNLAAFPANEHETLSFTVNGESMPLFAVISSACQVNLLAPTALASADGSAEVVVTKGNDSSEPFAVDFAAATPGMFQLADPTTPSRLFAIAALANTVWLALPDGVSTALGIPIDCESGGVSAASTCGRPAKAGDALQFYVTGLGLATAGGAADGDPLPDGEVAPPGGPLYETVARPRVFFGEAPGVEGEVLFSGLTPGNAGLYQVNVAVPEGVSAGDAVLVTIRMPDGSEHVSLIAIVE